MRDAPSHIQTDWTVAILAQVYCCIANSLLGRHGHWFCISMASMCQRCRRHRPNKRVRCISCWRAVGPGCWPNSCLLMKLPILSKTRHGLCADWPLCGEGQDQSWMESVRSMLGRTEPYVEMQVSQSPREETCEPCQQDDSDSDWILLSIRSTQRLF